MEHKTIKERLAAVEATLMKLANHTSEITNDMKWVKRLLYLVLAGIVAAIFASAF